MLAFKMSQLGWGLILCTLLIGGAAQEDFYCDPSFAPDMNSDGTNTPAGRRSDNVVKEANLRWLMGCGAGVGKHLVTYEALERFYRAHEALRKAKYKDGTGVNRNRARKAPFCIAEDSLEPKISRFLPIIKNMNRAEDFNGKLPVWDPRDSNNPVTKYGLQRISLMRIFTGQDTLPHLRQWFSLKLVFSGPLEGLFIQSISGPLGICYHHVSSGVPFGQFKIDFNCQDVRENNQLVNFTSYYEEPGIVPCTYRPGSAIRHPNVFAYGGEKAVVSPRTVFRVHFSWVDSICSEAPLMQFLIVAVKSFANPTNGYLAFKSPNYEHVEFDSFDGAPFPAHFSWTNQYRCDQNEMDPLAQFGTSSPVNLQASSNPNPKGHGMEQDLNDKEHSHDPPPFKGIQDFANSSGDQRLSLSVSKSNDPSLDSLTLRKMTNVIRARRSTPYDCTERHNCIHFQFKARVDRDIKFNKDYDNCILSKTGLNVILSTCPPGPFSCRKNVGIDRAGRIRRREGSLGDCQQCQLPPNSARFHNRARPVFVPEVMTDEPYTGRIPPPVPPKGKLQLINGTLTLELHVEGHYRNAKRLHGWLMILGCLVIMPALNFLARFFKETEIPSLSFFGMPGWLFGHVVLSYLGLTVIWTSISLISSYPLGGTVRCSEFEKLPRLPTDDVDFAVCDRYRTASIVHVAFGFLAIFLYHKGFVFGWIRPDAPTRRACVINYHSLSGYASNLFAGISALVAGACADTPLEVALLLISTVTMFLVGSWLQCLQDRRLDIVAPRTLFPALEGIQVRSKAPLAKAKGSLFILHWLIHVGLLVLLLVSYGIIGDNDKGNDSENEYEFEGLLGHCKAMGAEFLHRRVRCNEYTLEGCNELNKIGSF